MNVRLFTLQLYYSLVKGNSDALSLMTQLILLSVFFTIATSKTYSGKNGSIIFTLYTVITVGLV